MIAPLKTDNDAIPSLIPDSRLLVFKTSKKTRTLLIFLYGYILPYPFCLYSTLTKKKTTVSESEAPLQKNIKKGLTFGLFVRVVHPREKKWSGRIFFKELFYLLKGMRYFL